MIYYCFLLLQQPDLSDIEVPLKERKFKGYFLIARHYKWALNQIFQKFDYEAVIIVEGKWAFRCIV